MVTKQDVVAAYRLMLGREPEGEAVVTALAAVPTLQDLRQRFLHAPEFQAQLPSRVETFLPRLDLPPARVDTEASPAQLRALLDRVKAEWEELGRNEPHWSVLTHANFQKANLAAHRDDFFKSGSYVATILEAFGRRHGLSCADFRSCFELGCGVGRITMHLSRLFPRVVAADISKFHLDVCGEELRRAALSNVELLCLTDVAQLQTMPRFDAFVSLIVLQHNPPPVIRLLLRSILERLAPKGIGVFQVMTWRAGYSFDLAHYLATPKPLHMEMHVFPQTAAFETIAAADCRVLEMREDSFASPRRSDILSNTFFVRKNG